MHKKSLALLSLFVLVSFTLSACGSASAAGPCTPAAGQSAHHDELLGYCVLYPAGYEVRQYADGSTMIAGGSFGLGGPPKPFVDIKVSEAAGASAGEVASDIVESFSGFDIAWSELFVDGELAVRLDGVPGQDIARIIVIVHNDRLFKMTFVPSHPDMGAEYVEMEALYEIVLRSFSFISSDLGGL